jgi:integrase
MSEWYSTYRANECGVARNNTCLLQISRIPKEIMNKPLPAVTAIELQQYINSMEHANPRADTQQLLTACLKYAFNSGHIKANIGMLLKVELPENKPKQILPRNLEEKFVNSFPEEYQGYVIGLIYTGARLGEFMSLNENWQTDIDYVNKKVKIRETKSLRQKDIRAGRTFMFREIPLLPEVAKINFPLKTIKQKTLNKNFNKVLTKLNEEDKDLKLKVTPHCMRHTFVSRCNEIGITKSVIKEIVGHKTDKMNAHYTHNTSELLDKEFAKLSISSPISIPIRFPDGKNDTEKVDNAANCHPKMIDFAS